MYTSQPMIEMYPYIYIYTPANRPSTNIYVICKILFQPVCEILHRYSDANNETVEVKRSCQSWELCDAPYGQEICDTAQECVKCEQTECKSKWAIRRPEQYTIDIIMLWYMKVQWYNINPTLILYCYMEPRWFTINLAELALLLYMEPTLVILYHNLPVVETLMILYHFYSIT